MPINKHSVIVKTITWYLNGIKFSSYKHAGLLKTWNPVQPTNPPPIYGLVWCYKESPTLTAWQYSGCHSLV